MDRDFRLRMISHGMSIVRHWHEGLGLLAGHTRILIGFRVLVKFRSALVQHSGRQFSSSPGSSSEPKLLATRRNSRLHAIIGGKFWVCCMGFPEPVFFFRQNSGPQDTPALLLLVLARFCRRQARASHTRSGGPQRAATSDRVQLRTAEARRAQLGFEQEHDRGSRRPSLSFNTESPTEPATGPQLHRALIACCMLLTVKRCCTRSHSAYARSR